MQASGRSDGAAEARGVSEKIAKFTQKMAAMPPTDHGAGVEGGV